MSALDCDACYVCRECGLPACRDENPSPCEDHRVCADCAECESCIEEGRLMARDYERWAAL